MDSKISLSLSDCLAIAVILRSAPQHPQMMIFADFGTFLAWRRQNLDDIISFNVQTVPYVCEEVVPFVGEPDEKA